MLIMIEYLLILIVDVFIFVQKRTQCSISDISFVLFLQ